MKQLLRKIFGGGTKNNFKELVDNGAQIIDVRTPQEFRSGHIKGAVNIPLNMLGNKLSSIKKDKPVITCCASGMRSASAKKFLQANGFTVVYNGGGWMSLQRKIS
jgi:phage shock protein E